MKKFTSMLLSIILTLWSVMPVSAYNAANVSVSGFENDPFAIQSRTLSYEAYFQNEYGFFLDDWSNKTAYLALQKSDGSMLFTTQENNMLYNGNVVSGCVGNREIVFFCVNQTIYRYHVQSKRIDMILHETSMITFYPITSEKILWSTMPGANILCRKAEVSDQIAIGLTYNLYDYYRNFHNIPDDPGKCIFWTQCGPYMNYHSIPVNGDVEIDAVINGKTVPHPNYPAGSIWDECDPSINASECAAFAIYIYKYIWGKEGTMSSRNWAVTYANVSKLSNGARLRFSANHSAILVGKSTSSLILYQANWGGVYNQVSWSSYAYSTCQNLMGNITHAANPSSGTTI